MQLPLVVAPAERESALERELRALDIDRLPPVEALAWLAAWKRRLARGGRGGAA
jgi:hypothetical protein